MSNKISVCIIAKNEEKYIEDCLKRIKPYGFEIVVVDTGSTDRTREIAAQYADKVLDFAWINDFSAARNFAAAHASNNWILALDCDEYVEELDVGILGQLMERNPTQVGVIRLKNLEIRQDGSTGYDRVDVVRLYDRQKYAFEHPIHEQLSEIDAHQREEVLKGFLIPAEVVHHGYAASKEELFAKQHRNLELLFAQLKNNPTDAYTLFQIGQSYFVLEEYEQAREYYEKGIALQEQGNGQYVQVMVETLAITYVRIGRRAEALQLMQKYAAQYNNAKFIYMYANVCVDNDQISKALLLYIKASAMEDADTLGDRLFRCYEQIIAIYRVLGNDEMVKCFTEKYQACKESALGK